MLAYLSGWNLPRVWFVLVTTALTLYFSAAGTGLEEFLTLIRSTGRVSVVLIILVYVARAFPRTWLMRQRKYIGVSFAINHLYHLALIITAAVLHPQFRPDLPTIIAGSIVYLFIIAMLITSFEKPAKILGAKRWKKLHTIGLHVIFGAFVLDYILIPFRNPKTIPILVILLGAFAVRKFKLTSPSA